MFGINRVEPAPLLKGTLGITRADVLVPYLMSALSSKDFRAKSTQAYPHVTLVALWAYLAIQQVGARRLLCVQGKLQNVISRSRLSNTTVNMLTVVIWASVS